MVSPAHPAFRRHEGFTSDFYSLHYILFTEFSLLGKHLISFFLNKYDPIAGCYLNSLNVALKQNLIKRLKDCTMYTHVETMNMDYENYCLFEHAGLLFGDIFPSSSSELLDERHGVLLRGRGGDSHVGPTARWSRAAE
ncbi:uncharacterized protein CLUP02_16548 [Colletotrichum lupini]|uniref:Uncharacterized protein n=1 Tax=Colletotrichum lupini TaxID=145971 RepID=A0A9Q8T901_9PEZI|nr:uncharacterized protein CLUP02_16548 [Colletotrichum lupini]UQC91015.1 hypothetical protein CLUP02_16548 [Colletotrichum lupini]